jgi:hypothetical protein
MWTKVRELTKPWTKETTASNEISAQVLNEHYGDISTDSAYQPTRPKLTCPFQYESIHEIQIFNILDRLRPTAARLDQLPAWFLRLGEPVFVSPIVQLMNRSLHAATVSQRWNTAIINMLPHPSAHSDYKKKALAVGTSAKWVQRQANFHHISSF